MFSFHFQNGGTIYYEFRILGCQGDRMPMYRASAPFLQGDKGDRRVTGGLKSLRMTFPPIVYYRKTFKFSGEFEGLSVPNLSFIGSKATNSLENLKPTNAEFSFRAVIPIGLGGSKSTRFHPFWRCARQHLSPSCHPCHPEKRVQMPCTSAFCHPDTLFSKNSCMKYF